MKESKISIKESGLVYLTPASRGRKTMHHIAVFDNQKTSAHFLALLYARLCGKINFALNRYKPYENKLVTTMFRLFTTRAKIGKWLKA